MDIAYQMTLILGTCVAVLAGLVTIQTPVKDGPNLSSSFRPNVQTEPSKRFYESFVAVYTVVWISCFGCIVITQLYELFHPWTYIYVCGGLALPLLLQPFLYPGPVVDGQKRPVVWQRYSFRANLWLTIYSFIANYWFTHYFYSVLQAAFTMPNAIRLNNVPIAMYFATHFYFSSYHFFSNSLLRKIVTSFERTIWRDVLFVGTIVVLAYFTAFMETLSISAFPYWTFVDRDLAYSIGSAFYGIYFVFSFPAFYFLDRHIDRSPPQPLWEVVVSSCGYGMMILLVLDFVRLYLGIPLVVGGDSYY
jgi:cycloeucalenol cycloisomerase